MVKGLDKGEYTLVEVEAPKGYKVLSDGIVFEIQAKILPDVDDYSAQNWNTTAKDALVSFAADLVENNENAASIDAEDATVSLDVANTKVYDLPGTGGMGTTLIYIVGGALVSLAVVLFVIKRRKNA